MPMAMPVPHPALINFQRGSTFLEAKIHYIMCGKSDIFSLMQLPAMPDLCQETDMFTN